MNVDVIYPREEEIDRQLLPGSVMREINLVESVAELRSQMEDSNSAMIKTKKKIMVVSAILAIGTLFYAFTSNKDKDGNSKFAKYLKYIGTALAVLSLIKGASSAEAKLKVVPHSKEFSSRDRAYSYFKNSKEVGESTPFMKLVVKSILDSMIACKLIEPYDVRNKQKELLINPKGMNANIKNAIINY